MKKTTKRIISLMLCLLMLTGAFALFASAKDIESNEDDIAEYASYCEKSKKFHNEGNPDLKIVRDFSCVEDIKKNYGVEKNYILYYCKACGKNIREEFTAPQAHKMDTIKAVPATCTAEGTKEYYKCKACGKITSDKAGKNAVEMKDLKVGIIAHSYKDGKCIVCGAVQPNLCKYCGKDHGTSFSDRLTSFFHGILAAFGLKK